MPNLQYSYSPKLLALGVACVLSACGGGSGAEPGADTNDNSEVANTELVDMAMTGTVVIEERNGKTVIDGWFSQTPVSELDATPVDNTITADNCNISSVPSIHAQSSPVALGAATPANEFVSVGETVKIESRVGAFEALVEQEAGDITVYAPEERWQSDAVPDDAVITFGEGSTFGLLGSVKVPALMPLIWISPESGVLSNAASSLRWEASFNEQVQIKLRLSAVDFSDSDNPVVVTIACALIDDGLYTLPAQFQQQLPDDGTGIAVYAVRERVQQISDDDASLKVVQLSHPAPVKP